MLTVRLKLIQVLYGVEPEDAHRVQLGVAIAEDDVSLPFQRVKGTLDWGSGVETLELTGAAAYHVASNVNVTHAASVATVTLSPAPYTGNFRLYYDSNLTGEIAHDATAVAVELAVKPLLDTGSKLEASGEAPNWTLSFDSHGAAQRLTSGPDTLFAPYPLPYQLYSSGLYYAVLTASNFRAPAPETAEARLELSLRASIGSKAKQPVLFGPILPADIGFPNPSQWNFNTAEDIRALASNVKMILITEPGDRLMMPDYGCSLRQFLWEPSLDTTSNDIVAEIRRAITTWEPRVTIGALNAELQERSITVTATLVSRLNQERFQLNVELER